MEQLWEKTSCDTEAKTGLFTGSSPKSGAQEHLWFQSEEEI